GILLALSGLVQAVPMLYDVRYNPVPDKETELQFVFDEQLDIEPTVTVLNSPARLALFFPNAEFEESLKSLAVNKAGIQVIESRMEEKGFTLTVVMDKLKLYKTRVKNNLVYLQVSDNP
ncbi:type IV pilus secretin PilQ, partial [Pseudoalteromonas ruthenica]